MRVAIIGSGPSGLISGKHCLTTLKNLQVLHIYEKWACLGGAWRDDKEHTILYDSLRTNLPTEIMEFEGLSYENNNLRSSFVEASVVKRYLIKFADIFELKQYIKFETQVTKVSRIKEEWELIACHIPTNQIIKLKYDVIFVCNGHFEVPRIPHFNGLENFKRKKGENRVIHTIKYRRPEIYQGLQVLIIGGGPSAVDISIDVSPAAKYIYLSHHTNNLKNTKMPANIIHKPDIDCFDDDGVTFIDGTYAQIDRVILGTGYKYNLDFLDDTCGLWIEDDVYVTPLYKQFISIPNPTMVIIGLPIKTFIFPLLETQAKCMIQILNGNATLPSADEMHKERQLNEQNFQLKGIPKKSYHNIFGLVRQYMSELFALGNLEPLKEVFFNILDENISLRKENLVSYRNYKFTIVDSENYEIEHII
uniref:Flavin-containing monooxygenase n=1 Tax=Panstrongylus lignarius TaxID=156445 RepID=A0A224XD87_9HEMI